MLRAGFHIAQVNIALARAPLDSDLLSEFVAQLDRINALADDAPGFVWRLQTEDGNSLAVRGFDDDRIIVNLSMWDSIDHLAEFVYRSGHVAVMRRRPEWFERISRSGGFRLARSRPSPRLSGASSIYRSTGRLRTRSRSSSACWRTPRLRSTKSSAARRS